jgi:nucleoside-diphosphate-sugar epimerase
MQPNLLITDVSGFIGSHIVEGALAKDYAVQVLQRAQISIFLILEKIEI